VLGGLNVVALVLAVRFVLTIAVVGAFVLAYIAIQTPDPWRLAILAAYSLIVVVPLVYLSTQR
jgi:hypothetical protein